MIDDMAVYIANLGKYNEGYLVGAWFTFPIDEEDVKEKIGLNEQYEEYGTDKKGNKQGTSRCYQLCGGVRAVRFVYCLRSRLHQEDK